jgi:hypothetical protein
VQENNRRAFLARAQAPALPLTWRSVNRRILVADPPEAVAVGTMGGLSAVHSTGAVACSALVPRTHLRRVRGRRIWIVRHQASGGHHLTQDWEWVSRLMCPAANYPSPILIGTEAEPPCAEDGLCCLTTGDLVLSSALVNEVDIAIGRWPHERLRRPRSRRADPDSRSGAAVSADTLSVCRGHTQDPRSRDRGTPRACRA